MDRSVNFRVIRERPSKDNVFLYKYCFNPWNAKKTCIWKCRLFMSSAEYSCKHFKPIFAYRQIVWTLIRLLLWEQSDLGPHCLQKLLLKSQADDKADDNYCDWQFRWLKYFRILLPIVYYGWIDLTLSALFLCQTLSRIQQWPRKTCQRSTQWDLKNISCKSKCFGPILITFFFVGYKHFQRLDPDTPGTCISNIHYMIVQSCVIYRVYPKYWDLKIPYHALSSNLKQSVDESKNCWMNGQQCRPWLDPRSESAPFSQTCLSQ